MSMTIQSSVKDKILATPIDTSKVENAPSEMLRDLDQQMEKREDDGKANVVTNALSRKERVKPRRVREMAMTIQYGSEMDDLPRSLADAAESVRDAIGFELHVLWAEIGESSLTGLELVQETIDKGKLAPRYVEPFEILERIGSIACRLRLPEELISVHDTFHVSNLKKGLADANLHVPLDEIEADKTLHFVEETMGIMDHIGESSLTGLELVQETTDKVVLAKEKPKAARDHQKSYVDYRFKPLEFEVGDHVLLKVTTSYRLRLPEELSSVHDTFYVSNLKKGLADANLHVSLDEIEADKNLHFYEETMGIMDRKI
nr:hypothetical protein [Tanacetum cinerariifolium]